MVEYLDTWSQRRTTGELSLIDKIKLRLMQTVEKTLVSGLDATKLARIIDISHWQGDVDIALMVRLGDVAMCLPKCSDGKQVRAGSSSDKTNWIDDRFYENVQKCYDAGIPCGPYHYVQVALPDFTAQDLINWNFEILKLALGKLKAGVSYHLIMLDVEEKNATNSNAATVVMGLIRKIEEDPELSKVPILIYSSISVLNYYPALRDQLSYPGANRNLLMAQWVFSGSIATTWANLISQYLPKIEMKVLTPGYANWWGVQYSAAFMLEGCAGRLDQSLYRSTKAGLWSWLGYKAPKPPDEPPPPPPPPPPPDDLAAQVAANAADIAKLKAFRQGVKEAADL
jgi:GH25 family lysozyme M1 (1,4-beta-N-acetylmuramidase)